MSAFPVLTLFGVLIVFLSVAEGALMAMPKESREALRTGNGLGVRALRSLLTDPRELLFVLQILSVLSTGAFTLFLCGLFAASGGPLAGWWAALVAPPLVIVFAMLLPRAVAVGGAHLLAPLLALPLWGVVWLTWPLWAPLRALTLRLLSVFGVPHPEDRQLEEAQLKSLVDIGSQEGTLKEEERELIHNVFELGDVTASELMTPRTDMIAFSIDTPLEELIQSLAEERFARVPVYRERQDHVVGILYTRDLLKHRAAGKPLKGPVEPLLHPVWFVPGTRRADSLLREFQVRRQHMAVVVDEYGGVLGMVTMDDLLAALFGRTLDEHDVDEPELIPLGEREYRVHPQMRLADLYERLGLSPPGEEDITTVGGLVLARCGTLPAAGACIVEEPLEFQVEALEGTRLTRLTVRQRDPEPEVEEV